MTNDEAGMTREGLMTKLELQLRIEANGLLTLRISSFFRHSCFVIRHLPNPRPRLCHQRF